MDDSNANLKPSEMDPGDLLDVEAFNDEFTREFLQSTEETEEGFYPFLSKTGKYKMDFPAAGVIDDKMYTKNDDGHEEVPISIEDDTGFGMHVLYFSDETEDILEGNLHAFRTRLGYEGEFEEFKKNNLFIYYADYERNGFRTYVSYILNFTNPGGIELTYKIDCRNGNKEDCEKNKKNDKGRAIKWIESVEFIDEEGRENNGSSSD